MTASNREASISKTLTYEGGYTNDAQDPGGPTNWGITIADARMYWKPGATADDVKAMPKAVAIDIYRQKYWAKMDCDSQPAGPDFVDFDYGVNSGTARALSLRAKLTAQKLAPIAYVKAACAARSSFLHGLKTWAVFGKGWGRRVADVEATGVRMSAGATGNPVVPVLKREANSAAKKAVAHSTAAASTASASTGATTASAHHMDASSKAGMIFISILLLLALAYFLWGAVKNSQRAAAYTEAAK
jgi:lysozyme family protein